MAVVRFEDWPSRLDAILRETARLELEYGQLDCCMFCANVVRAITGHDPAHDLRGRYDSEQAAHELMKEKFCGYIEKTVAALARRSGFEEIPVLMASRGDVVLVGSNRLCAAGVIDMTGNAAIYPKRLLSVPIKHARRAWRV
jgi:hypothetical protein